MRMTRRGVLAALFATLPLVTLTGCPSGGGEKTGGDAPAVATGGGGGKKLVIAWAKWDPADNLQKLTADFTKETGIAVEVNQIPWSDFETKINAAWTGKSTEFDMVVGDSQWLGNGSTGGHYVDLTECAVCNAAVGKPMKLPER